MILNFIRFSLCKFIPSIDYSLREKISTANTYISTSLKFYDKRLFYINFMYNYLFLFIAKINRFILEIGRIFNK